jgi:hypothetical protein
MVGHRVVLRETCRKKFPELVKETGNLTGTVTWVDPTDADGDGKVQKSEFIKLAVTGVKIPTD